MVAEGNFTLRDRLVCPAKFMSCFVYILEDKEKRHYIGMTKLDPLTRLNRHNSGDVYSTKWGKPWKLVHFETFESYFEARKREKQIKSWHGGNGLKKLLSKAAGSASGRPGASEASNLGSNPSPAALDRKYN